MGSNNLIEYLKDIQDFRSSRGRQYELWLILLLIVMGSLTGCHSYLALEDFAKPHHQALGEKLGLNLTRFPSDTTFRRIFHRLDFGLLAETFDCWMKHDVEIEPGEWFSIDGKSIKGTVNNSDNASPNFVSLVSVYSHSQGVVVALEQFENKEQSELKVVQHLLEVLHLEQVVFSLDALHTQKKQPV